MQHSKPKSDLNGVKPKPKERLRQRDKSGVCQSSQGITSQKTVDDLFLTSKHKRDSEAADFVSSSPSKRHKRDSPRSEATIEAQPKTIELKNMYTFNPTGAKNGTVIDLTSSPDNSPAKGPFNQRRTNGGVRPPTFTPHMGAKKLIVKNFRKTSKSCPDQYFKHTWSQLDAALSAIFHGGKAPNSLEELYRGVENICRQDRAPALFEQLREKCKDNVSTRLKPSLISNATSGSDTDFLRVVLDAWSTWSTQLVHFVFPLN